MYAKQVITKQSELNFILCRLTRGNENLQMKPKFSLVIPEIHFYEKWKVC